MTKLNVLYQSNEAFVIPLAVSMLSLYENNKAIDRLEVYVIDDHIEEHSRKHLTELAAWFGRELHFIYVDDIERFLIENDIEMQQVDSYTTFMKIFVADLLPQLDRILYIDADTIVLDSLAELCDLSLEGYGCAMVNTAMCGKVKTFLDTPDYCNAGVIYIHLKYWREQGIQKQFSDVIIGKDRKRYTLVGDESLFNLVLQGKILKIPLKYNFDSSWWLWGWNKSLYRKLGWTKGNTPYGTAEEILRCREHPAIAHYINLTTGRPWEDYNDNPFRKEFAYYLERLRPWQPIRLPNTGIGSKHILLVKLKYLVRKMMPFGIRSVIGFHQHESAWQRKIDQYKREEHDDRT